MPTTIVPQKSAYIQNSEDLRKPTCVTPIGSFMIPMRPWGWDGEPVTEDDDLYQDQHFRLYVELGTIRREGKPPIVLLQGLNNSHRPTSTAYFGKSTGRTDRRAIWQTTPGVPVKRALGPKPYGSGRSLAVGEFEYQPVQEVNNLVPADFLGLDRFPSDFWDT